MANNNNNNNNNNKEEEEKYVDIDDDDDGNGCSRQSLVIYRGSSSHQNIWHPSPHPPSHSSQLFTTITSFYYPTGW